MSVFTPEVRVVDDRVFLLGLDQLYREAVQPHERGELLDCARRVASVLQVRPACGPVEGYYAEDGRLTEYFSVVRALQDTDASARSSVHSLPEFRRLLEVTSAPLYGPSQDRGKLLPVGRDPLSQALRDTWPDWTVERLVAAAGLVARQADDISLVGLAARVQDGVVLTALRESVALYAERPVRAAGRTWPPRYAWKVSQELAGPAKRFTDNFDALFGESLPAPEAAQAERYWHACANNWVPGRCVGIGSDDSVPPVRHYHWAIRSATGGALRVEEFWDSELWTTERYRKERG